MPRDQADRADQPGQTRTQAPATPRSATARSPSSAIALARGWVFLTAVRCHGVAYHGSDTEKYLGEVDGLNASLPMHLAEEDEFISKAAQAEIKAAPAKKLKTTVYSYPGQNHAFSRHGGTHYNADRRGTGMRSAAARSARSRQRAGGRWQQRRRRGGRR